MYDLGQGNRLHRVSRLRLVSSSQTAFTPPLSLFIFIAMLAEKGLEQLLYTFRLPDPFPPTHINKNERGGVKSGLAT